LKENRFRVRVRVRARRVKIMVRAFWSSPVPSNGFELVVRHCCKSPHLKQDKYNG
jgi:hypothetical protein